MKNANNLAVLYNRHETCFNGLHVKMSLLYLKFGDMTHKKEVKQKTPYIGNLIPFTFFAFLARPVLTYCKFNTGILMND